MTMATSNERQPEYTAGPWVAESMPRGRLDMAHGERWYVRTRAPKQPLGADVALVVTYDNRAANARLMAAAPELLAAANRALAIHEDVACSCEGCSMLRAAIIKAIGGAK